MSLVDQIKLGFEAVATTIKPLVPPPIDTFVAGWAFFRADQIEAVVASGSLHAAVSIGPQTPTINGVAFEQAAADTADINVPTPAGWSGTNWQVRRASDAPSPPTIGNNNARLETSAYGDLPDPSFGDIAGVADLCNASLRRNSYWTVGNLTVGRRYYISLLFLGYPDGLTRATILESDDGDRVAFGVDGADSILSRGIRRFGFVAASTSYSILKYGPDNNGSYVAGMVCTDEGAP